MGTHFQLADLKRLEAPPDDVGYQLPLRREKIGIIHTLPVPAAALQLVHTVSPDQVSLAAFHLARYIRSKDRAA